MLAKQAVLPAVDGHSIFGSLRAQNRLVVEEFHTKPRFCKYMRFYAFLANVPIIQPGTWSSRLKLSQSFSKDPIINDDDLIDDISWRFTKIYVYRYLPSQIWHDQVKLAVQA